MRRAKTINAGGPLINHSIAKKKKKKKEEEHYRMDSVKNKKKTEPVTPFGSDTLQQQAKQ